MKRTISGLYPYYIERRIFYLAERFPNHKLITMFEALARSNYIPTQVLLAQNSLLGLKL
jgi:hypothetical protein